MAREVYQIVGSSAASCAVRWAPFGVIPALVLVGFVMNLGFVVMAKMHWSVTENPGRALPTE